jgi:hypothetical protein
MVMQVVLAPEVTPLFHVRVPGLSHGERLRVFRGLSGEGGGLLFAPLFPRILPAIDHDLQPIGFGSSRLNGP